MKIERVQLVFVIIIMSLISCGIYYYNTKEKNIINLSNKSSKEYAAMGQRLWSSFECASWASKSDNSIEASKLFQIGYGQGKMFINAKNNNKIEKEDLSQEVPMGVLFLLNGPNEDFMIGKIYSAAEEEALKDVYKTGEKFNTNDEQKNIADNKFRMSNCQLIENI